jgi:arylsulfatase A-like enzyme
MRRSNVLLVVLDAVRKDHLSCYGAERRTTPTLERLAADPDGVAYEHAVSAAPWTLPSHASMFTGRYPSHHRCIGTHPNLDADQPVVAELLQAAGYDTFGFSNSSFTGTARGYARGFDGYHDLQELPRAGGQYYELSPEYAKLVVNNVRRGDDASYFQTKKLESRLRRAGRTGDPFFGFVNLNSAHSPYDPPASYREWAEAGFEGRDRVRMDVVEQFSEDAYAYMAGHIDPTDEEWELLRRWYDGEIRYLDDLLAGVVGTLERADRYDDTTIVVTADHGEHFGEFGLAYHQFSLSEVLVNVPLVVKWARGLGPGRTRAASTGEATGVTAGDASNGATIGNGTAATAVATARADELVSLVDLAPTFLDLAGVADRPATMQGRSLLSEPEPAVVFAEYGFPYPNLLERKARKHGDHFGRWNRALQAARTRTHKLVVASDGESTLYELVDGTELPVEDDAVATVLADAIDATLASLDPAAADEEPDADLDEHVTAHLEHLGYL